MKYSESPGSKSFNLKPSSTLSRFSVGLLFGNCAVLALFFLQYDGLSRIAGPGVVRLSILLLVFSLLFGGAQKLVALRLARNSPRGTPRDQGVVALEKVRTDPPVTDLSRLFDLQFLLTVFQAALSLCVVLLFGMGVVITLFVA